MVYDLYEYQDQSFDVNVWSTIISDASMVVFQFPFHWMSAPSLLKKMAGRGLYFPGKDTSCSRQTVADRHNNRFGVCRLP